MAVKVKRALFSVSNKAGIVKFAEVLKKLGVEIISTGGTYNKLKEANIKVLKVENVTGFPEMLDGRVKTLHPYIHGAILADRSSRKHMNEIFKAGIKPIDLVVVNLYPFKKTISKENVTMEEAIENIDIGGPTMIRSAAKNYKNVAVIVDPEDYETISEELIKSNGIISNGSLISLAVKAFQHTCEYDSVIFNYFIERFYDYKKSLVNIRPYLEIESKILKKPEEEKDTGEGCANSSEVESGVFKNNEGKFNDFLNLKFIKKQELRYGENPHQHAAYYRSTYADEDCFVNSKQLQGKELSYNNILDSNAAFLIVKEFADPCVVVIKHNNPCGAATGESVVDAYRKAYECDPVSAFGSIVACNVRWTCEASEFLMDKYVEVLVAPDFEPDALKMMGEKQNLRVLKVNFSLKPYIDKIKSASFRSDKMDLKSIDGGILVQDLDEGTDRRKEMKVATDIEPSYSQWEDLLFGWQIVKSVKSNAIVLANGKRTVGIGAGQMSRVDAVKIAIEKAGKNCKGSVLASDAFFPFEDAVQLAYKSGVTAVIQPGGSVRDRQIIDYCNKNKIPMVFTGRRHFRH